MPKQQTKKKGWSTSEIIEAGLASSEQQQAAQQLARGVSSLRAGEFALDEGWGVQVVNEPKPTSGKGTGPPKNGSSPTQQRSVSSAVTSRQGNGKVAKTRLGKDEGGKSGGQVSSRVRVNPQSAAGSKALAGLAEYMKAQETEAKRQQATAQAAEAARISQAACKTRKQKGKQRAPSLFGDLPEFDSSYRKMSMDNLKGQVVARLPGFDPSTGEMVPLPGAEYGEVQVPSGAASGKGRVGKQRGARAVMDDMTLEDLWRQQQVEEVEAAVGEEEEQGLRSPGPSMSEEEEDLVSMEELRSLLSMEGDVLAGLQDLMPDDDELLAMLKPMMAPTSTPDKPPPRARKALSRAAPLGTYSKGAAAAAVSTPTARRGSTGVTPTPPPNPSPSFSPLPSPPPVAASSPSPSHASTSGAAAAAASSPSLAVGAGAPSTPLVLRQRRHRAALPTRVSRLRRQFSAPEPVVTEVVEEGEVEEEETHEVDAADQAGDSKSRGQTGSSTLAADQAVPGDVAAEVADTTPKSSSLPSSLPSSPAASFAAFSPPATLSAPSPPSTPFPSSPHRPHLSFSPEATLPLADMVKGVDSGSLDESQLTPLARKLLRYQQQYKQIQKREMQRQAAEQKKRSDSGTATTARSTSSHVPPGTNMGSGHKVWALGAKQQRTIMEEQVTASGQGGSAVRPAVTVEKADQALIGRGLKGQVPAMLEDEEAKLEAELSQYFTPEQVKRLLKDQRSVDKHNAAIEERSSPEWRANRALHRRLKIVGGSCRGRRIWSSRGPQTRPMMERVRHAVFNMLHSFTGMLDGFDTNMRCLDLFAGTGSVGIEAVSRGCSECHFVEMDPWVVRNVTRKNVDICGMSSQSVFHTARVEDFLGKAVQLVHAHKPFDIISMCPPYLLVSYPQLFDLLAKSPFLHENTFVVVEYPRQLKEQIPDDLGPLTTLRDREYGRTWIRVYGPNSLEED